MGSLDNPMATVEAAAWLKRAQENVQGTVSVSCPECGEVEWLASSMTTHSCDCGQVVVTFTEVLRAHGLESLASILLIAKVIERHD